MNQQSDSKLKQFLKFCEMVSYAIVGCFAVIVAYSWNIEPCTKTGGAGCAVSQYAIGRIILKIGAAIVILVAWYYIIEKLKIYFTKKQK